MDRGAWWATVHEVAKSRTQLSDYHTWAHTRGTHSYFEFLYTDHSDTFWKFCVFIEG